MKKSSVSGKKVVYSLDGHKHYVSETDITQYLAAGYTLVNPYKKKSKIDKLIEQISKEALLDYYEIKNNSVLDTAMHFNISKAELYSIMKKYNIHKSSDARTLKIKQGKLLKYGDENYNNSDKIKQTCLERYGVDNQFKRESVRNLTESLSVRKAAQLTYFNKTGKIVWNDGEKGLQTWIEGQAARKSATQRANGTFNTSQPEEELYKQLVEKYGEVKRNYNEDPRYPFHCDFYVPSEDLFIELNDFPTHYKEPFDENNEEHIKLLEKIKCEPKDWVEEKMVDVWAGTDVLKRETAKKNNLNYKMIYGGKEYVA